MKVLPILWVLIATICAEIGQKQLVLPVYVDDVAARLIETATKQETYVYSAPKLGNTSFYPSGPGGQQMVLDSLIYFEKENAVISGRAQEDIVELENSIDVVRAFFNDDRYTVLIVID